MRVAGIDFSSLAIDVVLVDVDDFVAPEWFRFDLSGTDAFERTRSVSGVMPSRGSGWWDDVIAVGIEHPAGRFGVGPMLRVQGAVLSCLPAGVLVQPWPPSSWRKAVGLAGNASKFDVSVYTMKAAPFGSVGGWPQDACDAYCIALATRAAIERKAA